MEMENLWINSTLWASFRTLECIFYEKKNDGERNSDNVLRSLSLPVLAVVNWRPSFEGWSRFDKFSFTNR